MTDRSADAPDLLRRLVAEALGTAFLLAAVVGSGIMADRLSGGNVGLALLANAVATGAVLVVLIVVLGPVSGAHFNPAVTLSLAARRALPWREVLPYVLAQVVAGISGVVVANLMFDEAAMAASSTVRDGSGQLLAEFVATFGLVGFIWACIRRAPAAVAPVVGLYITAAYWFTSSTSFANPAVTIARTLTDTFAGIRPADAPAFILMQIAGALTATMIFTWLMPAHAATSRAS